MRSILTIATIGFLSGGAGPHPGSMLPTVDVHAHVWLPGVHALVEGRPGYRDHLARELRRSGTTSAEISAERIAASWQRLTDPDTRIAVMTATSVDVQVVSVTPTQYHHWTDAGLAAEVATATNEGVAAHCARHPKRLAGLGVVPLQHPAAAVATLEHAVLHCGLLGIEISSHAPDPHGGPPVELSDRALDPFWARAEELGAVLFLHPWGCTLDERLDRWYLSNSVGQPVEHAVVLSHLVFGGAFDRFPRLRVLAAHGGGYLPAHLGRNDHAWANRPDARGCTEPPSNYLRRMWFDSLFYTPVALDALVRVVGADRVVLGSDYPFDMGVEGPVRNLREMTADPALTDAIRAHNAHALDLLPRDRTDTVRNGADHE
jgi:aminocarboxymuconate-semialdehyde decarboxylase